MEKTIYFIRHGYALHNKLFWDIGPRAYSEYRDTPLLEKGYEQAKRLNRTWNEIDDIQLISNKNDSYLYLIRRSLYSLATTATEFGH